MGKIFGGRGVSNEVLQRGIPPCAGKTGFVFAPYAASPVYGEDHSMDAVCFPVT